MLATLMAFAGCGSVQPQQPSDALKILQAGALSTASLQSVQLDFKFGPGFQMGGIGLVSAVGKFKAPADSDIVAKASTGQEFVEPELLTIGGKIYIKLFQLQALFFERFDFRLAGAKDAFLLRPLSGQPLQFELGDLEALPDASHL